MKKVEIVERIEGEAKLNCSWKNGIISDARIDFLNFRGFEYILEGKAPLDALIYTPRICGICGQAHLKASVEALEDIYKNIGEELTITNKAKILREIGLNIEIIDSHIKWFYMFILPDIIKLQGDDLDIYTPLKGSRWIEASKTASETIKALALIGGQWPHTSYMVPGGVMCDPTLLELSSMRNYLDFAVRFFENSLSSMDMENYLSLSSFEQIEKINGDLGYFRELSFNNNLQKLGESHNRFISLGESSSFIKGKIKLRAVHKLDYSKIKENDEETFSVEDMDKTNKHTWSKSVQYNDNFYETGPLARAILSNRKFIKSIHKEYKDSIFTRVMARMDELAHLLIDTKELISKVDISEESFIKPNIELKQIEKASGISAVEACRGSLYHNIQIEKGLIKKYDVITPTVWNLGYASKTQRGVAQEAIVGLENIELAKIALRSFDVCSVCTTH